MWALRVHGYALAVSFCFIALVAASRKTDPLEVKALKDIKKSLIDPSDKLRNWNKGDPCAANWTGVRCFDLKGDDGYFHIRELYLMTLNLSGTLAPQLGMLSHLVIMNFMWNNLIGTIPKEIGHITSLILLLLSGNKLSGSLPDELGNLKNLNRLQVDENQLSGLVPKSFANLVHVKHLHMNNNSFNGQLPSELSNVSNLIHLLLDNNNFSGYLPPEFSKLQSLAILQLDNNNFSGNGIPSTFENLLSLVKLSLRNCSLEGAIPDFSSIRNLTYLDLSWNQFTGPIPSKKLADNMTTFDLSHNKLNGSIPRGVVYPHLQRLQLENNLLSGSVPATIWQNISFSKKAKLIIDLDNNLLSDIFGDLNPPINVTLRLSGNPVCKKSNIQGIGQFCAHERRDVDESESTNSTDVCPIQSCPVDNFFEYSPSSPVHCFCAAPLRVGYRLKSPSFSYFPPYITSFESYITASLNLSLFQLSIDSYEWEKGPRLRMYFKFFPSYNDSYTFNISEILRIGSIFASWGFPRTDFFGPYELLNVTLLGPYANMIINTESGKGKKGIKVAILIAAAASILAISVIIILNLLLFRRKLKYRHLISSKPSDIYIKIDGVKSFTLKELTHATNKFDISTKVGEGGYGNVYKGILSDETVVAVKRAGENSLQGQKEFLTEIELLSRLHHRNLVSLLGYCNEEGEQMLVYEFMPNGTLREWISGKSKKCNDGLSFFMRLRIAMDAAKGILYLHTEANPPVYHRDIKATNILLDSKFTAKVADFGLSRLAPYSDEEGNVPKYISTVVKGTPGYLDPEYMMTHMLTDKSDVYSLGIVFLELLTGMHAITRGKNIVREVNLACRSGIMDSIIDNRMGEYPSECTDKFLALALSCCHDHPEERPSMLDVVRELEDIIALVPETEISLSDVSFDNSGKMAPSSSSSSTITSGFTMTRMDQQNMFSYVSGSDLVSDINPTIVPR
ncbi:probable LRR receptor-like serine/threonine-protein kinase At1g06840 isoform X2 [Medicago truncatula]|uniref:probable LRR receptor-like serine/threonine-protein kinase At1g06840 isoform X2 n=1 Tax=Medicago truncatula TaxID=3880 RepID=UPI000D2F18C8|nr:probable LRR receptor-like serine/threonine-protein kinase At1g06840 isoform X2 [Medicago truncatula]